MARVAITDGAHAALGVLVESRQLPPDTGRRILRLLTVIGDFPESGRPLDGEWTGFRYFVGLWPWLLTVYRYEKGQDVVVVTNFEDSRTKAAVTHP